MSRATPRATGRMTPTTLPGLPKRKKASTGVTESSQENAKVRLAEVEAKKLRMDGENRKRREMESVLDSQRGPEEQAAQKVVRVVEEQGGETEVGRMEEQGGKEREGLGAVRDPSRAGRKGMVTSDHTMTPGEPATTGSKDTPEPDGESHRDDEDKPAKTWRKKASVNVAQQDPSPPPASEKTIEPARMKHTRKRKQRESCQLNSCKQCSESGKKCDFAIGPEQGRCIECIAVGIRCSLFESGDPSPPDLSLAIGDIKTKLERSTVEAVENRADILSMSTELSEIRLNQAKLSRALQEILAVAGQVFKNTKPTSMRTDEPMVE